MKQLSLEVASVPRAQMNPTDGHVYCKGKASQTLSSWLGSETTPGRSDEIEIEKRVMMEVEFYFGRALQTLQDTLRNLLQ